MIRVKENIGKRPVVVRVAIHSSDSCLSVSGSDVTLPYGRNGVESGQRYAYCFPMVDATLYSNQPCKQAQLVLGIIYEEGLGVPVSIATAKKLYRLASRDSGGTLWVYTPAVGKDVPGRVIPVGRGPTIQGLSEARSRLDRLGGRP